MKSHSSPKQRADIVHAEWTRKTQSPTYIRRAKRLAQLMKDYLTFARPTNIRPFVKPPTRRERMGLLHEVLDTMVFEDRRRSRASDKNNAPAPTAPSPTDWAAPTTSMLY
jgi:hypothetical protein